MSRPSLLGSLAAFLRQTISSTCVAVVFAFFLYPPGHSSAANITRVVPSGKKVFIRGHHSWDRDCRSATGQVKLLVKPRNGTLTTGFGETTIRNNRYRPGVVPRCAGKPVKTFEVYYSSPPGFRGRDSFVIEVTHGPGRSAIDHYSLRVR